MSGSGRQPINAPAGGSNKSGVPWVGLGILIVLALILAAFVAYFFFDVGNDKSGDGDSGQALLINEDGTASSGKIEGHSDGSLGFPAIATRNTTRISGNDSTEISIAAALAAYPTTGPGTPPEALTIVNAEQWQAGVAAATLSAAPVGAPILLAPSGKLSNDGAEALSEFDPQGSPVTGESEVFSVGDVAPPPGYDTKKINAKDPATLAVDIARLKAELTGEPPDAFVVVSSSEPEYASPAASWLARSGDVLLFTDKDKLPDATLKFLKEKGNKDVPIFVLGPTDAVSADTLKALGKISKSAERVGGEDPVSAALELVRYSSGTFGWNLNTPGHGYMIARSDRPMDAVAASALSTGGTWPALLLTDASDKLPEQVGDYLLDIKPGYETDPTLALYNHVWIIGDESLIDVNQQALIDEAAELAPVGNLQGGP